MDFKLLIPPKYVKIKRVFTIFITGTSASNSTRIVSSNSAQINKTLLPKFRDFLILSHFETVKSFLKIYAPFSRMKTKRKKDSHCLNKDDATSTDAFIHRKKQRDPLQMESI